MTSQKFGLSVALSTPFDADGRIDGGRLVAHARATMEDGAQSVTLFGTTGEGFSISPRERTALLDTFKAANFRMRDEVGIGIMAPAPEEAARQIAEGLDYDCRHFLLTPPFFFKGATDDGIVAWHAAVLDALGGRARDVVLYNLPSQTAVTLSLDVVGRLKGRYRGTITGVKDSSSNLPYSQSLVARHGDLAILIGDERLLADIVRRGGQGSICGLANFEARRMRRLIDTGRDDPTISAMVDAVCSYPVLPAIKAILAHDTGYGGWARMRPPVTDLPAEQAASLNATIAALRAAGAQV